MQQSATLGALLDHAWRRGDVHLIIRQEGALSTPGAGTQRPESSVDHEENDA